MKWELNIQFFKQSRGKNKGGCLEFYSLFCRYVYNGFFFRYCFFKICGLIFYCNLYMGFDEKLELFLNYDDY